ncbi:TPA: SIR2 family protein [Citrobacter freundii]
MNDDFDFDGERSEGGVSLEISSYKDLELKFKDKRVCLFLGAGFSKAWDNRYPLSDEVFSISEEEASEYAEDYGFFSLFEGLNLRWGNETSKLNERANVFKTFKYTLDVYKRYPSLLPAHLDRQTLDFFEREVKTYIKNKFKRIVPPTELKLNINKRISADKKNILSFFSGLKKTATLDVITTNYDIVIDRVLREVFSEQSIIRGFPVHHDKSVQCPKPGGVGLYKLNGGFEVISCSEGFNIDYDSISNEKQSPNIILPSNEQDYGDKYFKNAFVKSSNQLRYADMLIFIGYSFPREDYIINFLLKTFLDNNNTEKETVIVSRNKDSAIECHMKACDIFKELNDKSGLYYYGGSFADLCKGV